MNETSGLALMKATKLKQLFPGFWKEIYNSTKEDVLECFIRDKINKKDAERIAYNCAFNACYSLYKRLFVE